MGQQLFFLFLTCFLFICFAEDGEQQKRFLLDDPTVISNRLTRLENSLEILNRTVYQQAITIQHQATTIQQQTTTIRQQTTTIQQQATTILQHTTTNQQQASTIQQLELTTQRHTTTCQQQASTIQQLELTTQKQDVQMKQLQTALTNFKGTGSTYVIWGRKQCPNNTHTEQVYSGFAGGGLYSEPGSAAEFVCLPPNPDFDKTSAYTGAAHMYGAEFDGYTNEWGAKSYNEDVPCALCRIELATTIMISGKNKCYYGWTLEYYGYLAAGAAGQTAASSYVCVDIHPEYLNAGVGNNDGKLFFPVVAKCGSLQCPPYINNYPLTCAVCSK